MRGRSIALTLFAIAALVGCDDGPSLQVTPEPAGPNCPTGGFLIEADGQTFYSCNGQATTEEIPEGAEGNPCFGPALRVSVPTAEGTRYAYVCQPIEVDPASASAITLETRAELAYYRLTCDCTTDPEERASCQQELDLYDAILQITDNCIPEVLAVTGPVPEADRAAIECVVAAYDAAIECLDGIDTAECSMETEEELLACQALGDEADACPEPTEAFDDWMSTVEDVGEFLGCEAIGGF